MNAIKLAARYVRKGGIETIVTLFGVFFVTFLITFISTAVSSLTMTLEEDVYQRKGRYHICYRSTSKEATVDFLKNNVYDEYATASLDFQTGEGNTTQRLLSVSDKWSKIMPVHIVEGSFPKESGGIVIPQSFATETGLKVGQSFDPGDGTKYEITGIYDHDQMNAVLSSLGINEGTQFFTVSNDSFGTEGVFVLLKLRSTQSIEEFYAKYGYDAITINSSYIDVSPVEFGHETMYKLLGRISSFVYILIISASFLFVGNAFLSVEKENSVEYGTLLSVGATNAQIYLIIVLKGVLIAAVALIPGFLCGSLMVIALIPKLSKKIGAILFRDIDIVFAIDPKAIITIVILTIFTAVMSAVYAILRLKHGSVVSLIKGNYLNERFFVRKRRETAHGQYLKVLSRRFERKHVGKKVSTVLAVCLSIVIYTSFALLCDIAINEISKEYRERECDLLIYPRNMNDTQFLKWYESKIKADPDITESYWFVRGGNIEIKRTELGLSALFNNDSYVLFDVFYIPRSLYSTYCNELKVDENEIEGLISASDYRVYSENDQYKVEEIPLFEHPIKTKVSIDGWDRQIDSYCITKSKMFKLSSMFGRYLTEPLLLPYDSSVMVGERSYSVVVFSDSADHIQENLANEGIHVNNIRQLYTEQINQISAWKFFSAVFLLMVMMIMLSHTFFTVYSNTVMRKADFIVLKSLGATRRQVLMIFLREALSTLALALVFGVVISATAWIVVVKVFEFRDIEFPFLQTVLCVLGTTAGFFVSYGVAFFRIDRMGIIEEIRKRDS